MARYATADTHFWHGNILKYEKRPWDSVEKMNQGLIQNWNFVVSPEDEVFILGDFVWANTEQDRRVRKIVEQLAGRKHLILGNHDVFRPFTYVAFGILTVHTALDIGSHLLTHDPAVCVVDKTRKWLCGHVHSLFKEVDNVINVGVDVQDYFPVRIE